mmetsp:Transcript_68660/g.128089  ORF Transcript_68660/g.128089 Transcript_68660/m.128089 type:complete len:208 (-) Transcript_68660:284-907(-)
MPCLSALWRHSCSKRTSCALDTALAMSVGSFRNRTCTLSSKPSGSATVDPACTGTDVGGSGLARTPASGRAQPYRFRDGCTGSRFSAGAVDEDDAVAGPSAKMAASGSLGLAACSNLEPKLASLERKSSCSSSLGSPPGTAEARPLAAAPFGMNSSRGVMVLWEDWCSCKSSSSIKSSTRCTCWLLLLRLDEKVAGLHPSLLPTVFQ